MTLRLATSTLSLLDPDLDGFVYEPAGSVRQDGRDATRVCEAHQWASRRAPEGDKGWLPVCPQCATADDCMPGRQRFGALLARLAGR